MQGAHNVGLQVSRRVKGVLAGDWRVEGGGRRGCRWHSRWFLGMGVRTTYQTIHEMMVPRNRPDPRLNGTRPTTQSATPVRTASLSPDCLLYTLRSYTDTFNVSRYPKIFKKPPCPKRRRWLMHTCRLSFTSPSHLTPPSFRQTSKWRASFIRA